MCPTPSYYHLSGKKRLNAKVCLLQGQHFNAGTHFICYVLVHLQPQCVSYADMHGSCLTAKFNLKRAYVAATSSQRCFPWLTWQPSATSGIPLASLAYPAVQWNTVVLAWGSAFTETPRDNSSHSTLARFLTLFGNNLSFKACSTNDFSTKM